MNNQSSSFNGHDTELTQSEASISLIDLVDNVLYFRWHFIVTAVIVIMLSLAYAIFATPVYTADALIQVEEKKGSSLSALSQVANSGINLAPGSAVLGEIEIIRSRSVVGRAVSELKSNLQVSVDNRIPVIGGWLSRQLERGDDGLAKPLWSNSKFAWGGEQLTIDEFSVPNRLLGKKLNLKIESNEAWELFDNEKNVIASGKNDGALVVSDDGELRVQFGKIRARPGTQFRITAFSLTSRINQILRSLTVVETRRQSNILKISYENSNPAYAALFINTLLNVYLRQNVDRRSEEAQLSLDFLNSELPKLRTKLDASEKALNEFRSKTKTLDVSTEIKELLNRTTNLEKTKLELELKQKEYSERYDPMHPLMRALNAQIVGINTAYAQLSKQIGQLPTNEQDYIRLSRDVQVNNQLYVSLLNNAQQLQVAKAGTTANVAVVDPAVLPEFPSRPQKPVVVAIGSLLGLVLGFTICQIMAYISKIVLDPKKLESDTNLPSLAILPFDADQLDFANADSDKQANSVKSFLLAKEKPSASSVEALRSLRTAIIFKLSEKDRSKTVLITSAVPSQGKSFVAANLSYLFAATGKKVLLIEADIRLAAIKNYISHDLVAPGLSSVLKDQIPVQQAIQHPFPNLDLLPAGPSVKNPGDLLASDATNLLINSLAEVYDLVIIDSPPLLPVHDARSLGTCADISLFVALQGTVSTTEVLEAIDMFNKTGNRMDGLVFNGFVPSRLRYGYGYGYGSHRKYGKYRRQYRYGRRYQNYGEYGS